MRCQVLRMLWLSQFEADLGRKIEFQMKSCSTNLRSFQKSNSFQLSVLHSLFLVRWIWASKSFITVPGKMMKLRFRRLPFDVPTLFLSVGDCQQPVTRRIKKVNLNLRFEQSEVNICHASLTYSHARLADSGIGSDEYTNLHSLETLVMIIQFLYADFIKQRSWTYGRLNLCSFYSSCLSKWLWNIVTYFECGIPQGTVENDLSNSSMSGIFGFNCI